MQLQLKISIFFFMEPGKANPEIHLEQQWTKDRYNNFKEQNGGYVPSDIKAYYKALGIKTEWCWHRSK